MLTALGSVQWKGERDCSILRGSHAGSPWQVAFSKTHDDLLTMRLKIRATQTSLSCICSSVDTGLELGEQSPERWTSPSILPLPPPQPPLQRIHCHEPSAAATQSQLCPRDLSSSLLNNMPSIWLHPKAASTWAWPNLFPQSHPLWCQSNFAAARTSLKA